MLYLGIAFLSLLAWHIFSEISNRRERTKLLDRIMARTYVEYEYYDKKFPEDVKTVREAEKAVIATEKTALDESSEISPDQQKFLDGMDEDWRRETIDTAKLREVMDDNKGD